MYIIYDQTISGHKLMTGYCHREQHARKLTNET